MPANISPSIDSQEEAELYSPTLAALDLVSDEAMTANKAALMEALRQDRVEDIVPLISFEKLSPEQAGKLTEVLTNLPLPTLRKVLDQPAKDGTVAESLPDDVRKNVYESLYRSTPAMAQKAQVDVAKLLSGSKIPGREGR